MTIFINIASYCDPLLKRTILSALANAHHPENLRFGVVDQSPAGAEDLSQLSTAQIKYVRIDPRESRGCCWARALAQNFYAGEDWYLQIDAHMDFEWGWDHYLIEWASWLNSKRPSVISMYPPGFELPNGPDGAPAHSQYKDAVLYTQLVNTTKFNENGSPTLQFIANARVGTQPLLGFHVAAGLYFGPGEIAEKFPYDPRFYFIGEEQSLALRLFTHNWNIYHTPAAPIYHLYNTVPGSRTLHWDRAQDQQRSFHWGSLESQSIERFKDLVYKRKAMGAYGLGIERSLAEFAELSGIDYLARTIDFSKSIRK